MAQANGMNHANGVSVSQVECTHERISMASEDGNNDWERFRTLVNQGCTIFRPFKNLNDEYDVILVLSHEQLHNCGITNQVIVNQFDVLGRNKPDALYVGMVRFWKDHCSNAPSFRAFREALDACPMGQKLFRLIASFLVINRIKPLMSDCKEMYETISRRILPDFDEVEFNVYHQVPAIDHHGRLSRADRASLIIQVVRNDDA